MKDVRVTGQPQDFDAVVPVAAARRAPVTPAQEDQVLTLGWKVDLARDRLSPGAVIYTWYRDALKREGAIVSYILLAGQ